MRWRELGSGSGAELGNLAPIPIRPFNWVESPPVGESEDPKWQKPRGAE